MGSVMCESAVDIDCRNPNYADLNDHRVRPNEFGLRGEFERRLQSTGNFSCSGVQRVQTYVFESPIEGAWFLLSDPMGLRFIGRRETFVTVPPGSGHALRHRRRSSIFFRL